MQDFDLLRSRYTHDKVLVLYSAYITAYQGQVNVVEQGSHEARSLLLLAAYEAMSFMIAYSQGPIIYC